ncbi:carbohydrate ABC transporter permease [Cohnella herbarum]|uniref:Carbohydrate ABC transporter permease n=1 Tax=Cohnella herbarum TaxID=2728023 RepID=A0A7Z2VMC8_9BACL|nr:carbohydrate ABC transporter permease [Cohnella herbarum]QJD85682.1 carbohydrate ABC transporter permease [Cohnella herbarum]
MLRAISQKGFDVGNIVFLSVLVLLTSYPFYYILINSVSVPARILSAPAFLLPKGFTWVNYEQIFTKNDLIGPFFVSLSRAVVGTFLTLAGSSMLAYGLTKKQLPFRRTMYFGVIFTMYISVGLIPNYILMSELHLLDTYWVYVLPGIVNAFFLVLIKTYFEQLPIALEEAAMLEGAGVFTIFRKIVLPLSKPILATVAIFSAVGQWNSWVDNLYYVTNSKWMTLQLLLLNYIQSQSYNLRDAAALSTMESAISVTPQSLRMGITVLVIAPIFLVYPFLQKYFVKGIMLGAVKG